jgi:hypothetical protein
VEDLAIELRVEGLGFRGRHYRSKGSGPRVQDPGFRV